MHAYSYQWVWYLQVGIDKVPLNYCYIEMTSFSNLCTIFKMSNKNAHSHANYMELKGQSRLILVQESADLHKDHWCHHVNILDDVIFAKLLSWLWRRSMVR